MLPLARARGVATHDVETQNGELARYLESKSSLDSHILTAIGEVTQRRFRNVQERLGFFANRCPFTPPPRRKA
jgi:hypothetical protein